MKKLILVVLAVILIPLQTYAAGQLDFYWDFDKSEYDVYKGQNVKVDYYIDNREEFQISCEVYQNGDKDISVKINRNDRFPASFTYYAPSKIKNIQNPTNYEVNIDCDGTYSYSCGFLWLDTCYKEKEWSLKKSVKINFELTEQDIRNLNALEDYRKNIANKITDIDKKSQEYDELVSKTPSPLLPSNAISINSKIQESKRILSNRFESVINTLEKEEYSLGSTISLSVDQNEIENMDKDIDGATKEINSNLDEYNEIVTKLNTLLEEVKTRSAKLNYKFNANLMDKLNELGKSTHSRIVNYNFKDINNARSIINSYSQSKEDLLFEMEQSLDKYTSSGLSIILTEAGKFCSQFNLCKTKDKMQELNLESTHNFYDLCDSYDFLVKEKDSFNIKETERYESELAELNRKNEEIKDRNLEIRKEIEKIDVKNQLKNYLNTQANELETSMQQAVKKINRLGKTADLETYNKLVQEYKDLPLDQKEAKLGEISFEKNKIKLVQNQVEEANKGFFSFFKKAYYTVFGTKQQLEFKLNIENLDDLPELIPELQNNIIPANLIKLNLDTVSFISNVCEISDKKLSDLKANIVALELSKKESNIDVEVKESKKTCFNEEGERTTQCCDGGEYRDKEGLYPVIFVHGHTFEGGEGDVQTSLSTFNYMSDYLSKKGYLEKSLLYPESSEDLVENSWSYCNKPVVVRVTYYDGLVTGTTHNYKDRIADYSPVLKKQIDSILKASNKDKAIIVAHSMGGILSRYYIKYDGGDHKVYKLITLGSPHYGIRQWLDFWSPFGAKESQQMTSDSDFLSSLNLPIDSLVPTYTISGNNNGCTFQDCDGVVYVESSQLKNSKDSAVFEGGKYEHNEMLQQEDVAEKVLEFIKD